MVVVVVVGGGGWGGRVRGNHFRHGQGEVESFQTWYEGGGIISDMVRGRWNVRHSKREGESFQTW